MKCLIKPLGFLALLLFSSQAFSQGTGWSLGVGTGYMNYYGDLTPKLGTVLKDHYKIKSNDRSLDYGVFLERKLSSGTHFVINANMGSFKGNDLTASDDSLDLEMENRSLNFRTEVKDLSGTLHFKMNDGNWLPENSLIAPYFFVGVGVTQFEVFGDLKDSDGNLYDYTSDEVIQDGEFETNLSDLKVEKAAKQTIMNIPFGAGIRLNTGKNWSVNLQTDVKYMFTDYIDDAAKIYRDGFESDLQEYASNPNPRYIGPRGKTDGIKNDLYMFTSLSLRFNFGKKKSKGFVPPVFPPSGSSAQMINQNTVAGPVATKVDGAATTTQVEETPVVVEVEVTPTKEEMEAEVARMVEEQMAQQVKEIEIEREEVIYNTPNNGVMQAQNGAAPANYGGGSSYDPTVEMLKLEVDRLRSENSTMKGQEQINELKNEIDQLKRMMGNSSNGNQPNNGNYINGNNGAAVNGTTNNGMVNGGSEGNGQMNDYSNVQGNSTTGYTNNGNTASGQYSNNGTVNTEVKEEKKGLKKIFGRKTKEEKAAKKAEKKAKKAAKKANAENGTEEVEKSGFFGRLFNRNKDNGSVNVEEYAFNFVGDSFEMGGELQAQLKKVAKKARKSENAKVIIKSETTKANQAKTNTIAVKLAQVLAEDYEVDAGKISYDIKDVKSSPNSTDENQKVSIQLVY